MDYNPFFSVFIFSHGIRWIPNIYELQQAVSTKVGRSLSTCHRYNNKAGSGGPGVAPLGAVHHPLLPPTHRHQLLCQFLHLLPQALPWSSLQRDIAQEMEKTSRRDRFVWISGWKIWYFIRISLIWLFQIGETVMTRLDSKKVRSIYYFRYKKYRDTAPIF